MEKLRQAIRKLEAQAEKYERHLGAERIPAPSDAFLQGLTDDVNDVTELLELPTASTPAEATKPEESAKPATKDKAAPKP